MSTPLLVLLCVVVGITWLFPLRMVAGDVAHRIASHWPSQKGVPDSADWFVGIVCGLAWPVWTLFMVVRLLFSGVLSKAPRIGAEARHLARQRDDRIRELERDLDL